MKKAQSDVEQPPNSPEKKKDIVGSIALAFFSLLALATLLKFILDVFTEGWFVAQHKNPVGVIIFFWFSIAIYFALIPKLEKRGFKAMADKMRTVGRWVGGTLAFLFIIFIFGRFSSCDNDNLSSSPDIYYRK